MTDVTRTRFELLLQIDIPHPVQTGQGIPTTPGPAISVTETPVATVAAETIPGESNEVVKQAVAATGLTVQELLDASLNDPRIKPEHRALVSAAQNALLNAAANPVATETITATSVNLPVEAVSGAGQVQPSGVIGVPPAIETLTFRCVKFNSTFSMNRIPLASATIAVGRDARTLRAALVHARPDGFGRMYRARVILNPIGQWSASARNPNDTPLSGKWSKAGPRRIFDGYVTGLGYQKTRGTLQFSVQLIHWLSDLAFSSIFSNQSHPGNPADLTFSAVYSAVGAAGTAASSAFVGGHQYFNKFSSLNIQQDLWAKSLAEVFCEIGNRDLVQLGRPLECGGLDARNDFSLSALSRIEGKFSCRAPGAVNRWHVPLTLTGLGGDEGLVADAISQYVAQQTLRSWWSTSLWDKLVNDLGPAFMFHVIPRVETAIIAPFVAGLRDPWIVVRNVDVSRLFLQSYIRRPLRGVAIFAGRDAHTVATDPSGQNVPAFAGVGGCFMPDENARGMVIFKRAPAWMATIPNFVSKPSKTVMGKNKAGAAAQATNSATTPVADISDLLPAAIGGAGALATGTQSTTKGAAAVKNIGFHDRMAHYLYMMEVLRGRTGTLAGKFRLDIAPGTTILVEEIGEQIIEAAAKAGLTGTGIDIASPNLLATVRTVQFGLDAESGQAVTAFELAHIRTPAENTDDRTSIESHPLYLDQKYRGAPLVDEYLFD